jgi:hypothetical protein
MSDETAKRLEEVEKQVKELTAELSKKKSSSNAKKVSTAAKVTLNPKLQDGLFLRHVYPRSAKATSKSFLFGLVKNGVIVEANEDGTEKDGGKKFSKSPSNFGAAHYDMGVKAKDPLIGNRKQNSCNGWAEVEYKKDDEWVSIDELRTKEVVLDSDDDASSSSSSASSSSSDTTKSKPKSVPDSPVPDASEPVPTSPKKKVVRRKLKKAPVEVPVEVPAEVPAVKIAVPVVDEEMTDEVTETPKFQFQYCESVNEKNLFGLFKETNDWNNEDFKKHLFGNQSRSPSGLRQVSVRCSTRVPRQSRGSPEVRRRSSAVALRELDGTCRRSWFSIGFYRYLRPSDIPPCCSLQVKHNGPIDFHSFVS